MSGVTHGPGWWLASDGEWYPPDVRPGTAPDQGPLAQPPAPGSIPPGWPVHAPLDSDPTQPLVTGQSRRQAVGSVAPIEAEVADTATFHAEVPKQRQHRPHIPPVVAWIVAGFFFITTIALGIIALQQRSSAARLATAHGQGSTGATGPQGLSSAQYEGENAWSDTVGSGDTLANLPPSHTLTVTDITNSSGGGSVTNCGLSGTNSGNRVTYRWQVGVQGPSDPISGLQWHLDTNSAATVNCNQAIGGVTVSGYVTPS
jgi:hypothetical protein